MWRPVDWLAEWLRHGLGVQAQLRMGVLMVLLALAFAVAYPLLPEGPAIYWMSQLALLFAGVGVVVTAEALDEVTDETDDDGP